jgi:Glycosyltransferase family 25 (LPS biosynthesis protein)
MIVIKDNKASEFYAEYCKKSWKNIGLEVNKFDAITPKDLQNLNKIKWYKHSLQKKYTKLKINVDITETEKACFYSHYTLWEKCVKKQLPIMILEHDSYLESPENLWFDLEYGIIFYDKAAMGSYIIMPWFAQLLINYIKTIYIGCGPYSVIASCGRNNRISSKVINDTHKKYKAASNQVMSEIYGNTIEHFCNSNPELFNPEDFHKFIKI